MREVYNGGLWTKARFNSFIKSILRSGSQRWAPKYNTLAGACVGTKINKASGRMAKHYTCAKCRNDFPAKEVEVNHIVPVVPVSGFDNWDMVIDRLFCEVEQLEVLCKPCHKEVTLSEKEERKHAKSK